MTVEDVELTPHLHGVVVVSDELAVDLPLGEALAAGRVHGDAAVLGDVEVLGRDLSPHGDPEDQEQGQGQASGLARVTFELGHLGGGVVFLLGFGSQNH